MLCQDIVAAIPGGAEFPLLIVATMKGMLPHFGSISATVTFDVKAFATVFGKDVVVPIRCFNQEPLLIVTAVQRILLDQRAIVAAPLDHIEALATVLRNDMKVPVELPTAEKAADELSELPEFLESYISTGGNPICKLGIQVPPLPIVSSHCSCWLGASCSSP
jgi:hypothetical protein